MLEQKLNDLRGILARQSRPLIAFSGGVDSAVLLKVALDTLGPENVVACLAVSPTMSRHEQEAAVQLGRELGADLRIIHTKEMHSRRFTANTPERCYECRRVTFPEMQRLADQESCTAVLAGVNADDSGDYRPGLRAVEEFGVHCPLRDVGLGKDEVRTLARRLNLSNWDKPAQPCLATRIAYGLEVTARRLEQVEQAESLLGQLGISQSRVRHHDTLARIEVLPAEFGIVTQRRAEIVAGLKKLGFTYITLDIQGFRSGSGNEVL